MFYYVGVSKTITSNQLLGEQGEAAVRSRFLNIGFQFDQCGRLEAGIDGIVEGKLIGGVLYSACSASLWSAGTKTRGRLSESVRTRPGIAQLGANELTDLCHGRLLFCWWGSGHGASVRSPMCQWKRRSPSASVQSGTARATMEVTGSGRPSG